MKIYTKTGDNGTTSLFGGQRVDKNSARICAYGEVDELNSTIGVIMADLSKYTRHPERSEGSRDSSLMAQNDQHQEIKQKLLRIQKELFVLGADLATPIEIPAKGRSASGGKIKVPRVKRSFVTRLEKEIDKWSASLPQLKKFIFPGGGKIGSKLHLARSIARRAERSLVALSRQETINKNTQIYINRLSDWFFVAARYVNKLENQQEINWKGRAKT